MPSRRLTPIFLMISFSLFPMAWSMEQATIAPDQPIQPLRIPPILQEKSRPIQMLIEHKTDFTKTPLRWANESLVTQEELDLFARTCDPHFHWDRLYLDELMTIAHEVNAPGNFYDYFEIDFPQKFSLKNMLCTKVKENKLKLNNLPPVTQFFITNRLISDADLRTQLLKPYSDSILAHGTTIPNKQTYTTEKLLFASDTTKIYRANNPLSLETVKDGTYFPRFLIKDSNNVIQKEISFDLLDLDGYICNDIKCIHQSGLYAIAGSKFKNDRIYSSFALIDFKQQNASPLWDTAQNFYTHACCFGKDKLYTAARSDGNPTTIIIDSIELADQKKQHIVSLVHPTNEKIVNIAINKDENRIVVATAKTLFVINIDGKGQITTIPHNLPESNRQDIIIKTSLSNSGALLCVVTTDIILSKYGHTGRPVREYICNLDTKLDLCFWQNITQELKDNCFSKVDSLWPTGLQEFRLSDIPNIIWSHDDSLLILECEYSFYHNDLSTRSSNIRSQYAFVYPRGGKGWNADAIHKDVSIINDANPEQAISRSQKLWGPSTTLLPLFDKNMKECLDYFNFIKKNDGKWSIKKGRQKGLWLLSKILAHEEDEIVDLNEKDTEIYTKNLTDTIKILLAKIRKIILFEENPSVLSSAQKKLYVWSVQGRNLFRTCCKRMYTGFTAIPYRKEICYGIGAAIALFMAGKYIEKHYPQAVKFFKTMIYLAMLQRELELQARMGHYHE